MKKSWRHECKNLEQDIWAIQKSNPKIAKRQKKIAERYVANQNWKCVSNEKSKNSAVKHSLLPDGNLRFDPGGRSWNGNGLNSMTCE